ncbi:BMC domain-containing protein [Caloramator fervidus]|uniref:BMC domain-containing protein n=1 Tax=Caloramator fervidus TaxID=29344 RepID=A0A1H5RVA4_9CLOT|nr:BMC domain-containing protein [Caloramator fervidus]
MREAIGLIETRGLVAAIQAADTMVKTANVRILNYQVVGSGLVSVTITGDVAAVKAAVENAKKVAEEISEVISANVIARPHDEVDKMF